MAMTNAELLAHYEERLTFWEAAEESVATTGHSYSFDDGDMRRAVTSASASDIMKNIVYYRNKINRLNRVIAGTHQRIAFGRGRGRGL